MKTAEEWSQELFSPMKSGKYDDWINADNLNVNVIKQIQLDAISSRDKVIGELASVLKEAQSVIQNVGVEDSDDISIIATLEQLSGRVDSALASAREVLEDKR